MSGAQTSSSGQQSGFAAGHTPGVAAGPVPQTDGRTDTAIQRAAVYELLGRCFAYPDEAAVGSMRDVLGLVRSLIAGTAAEDLVPELETLDPGRLQAAYLDVFSAVSSPDCPTYESAFVCTQPAQQTVIMADVAGFYRAFGVEVSAPGFRPDDIGVELSFVGMLCRKQAYAVEHMGAPRVGQALKAQRLFLREHLGRWAEALGTRLMDRATHPFYGELGRVLRDWVAIEADGLKAEPIDRVDGPLMPFVSPARGGPEPIGGRGSLVSLEDIQVGR